MPRLYALRLDSTKLDALAPRLADMLTDDIGQVVVETLNETVDETYELSRERMIAGINLTDDYVRRKMRVEHATKAKPEAAIVASGRKADLTSLSHYGAQQLAKPVTWSNERITGMGKKFGPWPGWTRRRGNERVGIPVGEKAAGRSVEVSRGQRKTLGPTFAIPGKTDNEGNLLVFRRSKASGKLESLVGPSVYQLFGYQAARLVDDTADALMDALADRAEKALLKAIDE